MTIYLDLFLFSNCKGGCVPTLPLNAPARKHLSTSMPSDFRNVEYRWLLTCHYCKKTEQWWNSGGDVETPTGGLIDLLFYHSQPDPTGMRISNLGFCCFCCGMTMDGRRWFQSSARRLSLAAARTIGSVWPGFCRWARRVAGQQDLAFLKVALH